MADERPRWMDAIRSGFDIDGEGNIKIANQALAAYQASLAYAIAAIDPSTFLHHLGYVLEDPEHNMPLLLLDEQEQVERLHGMLQVMVALWRTRMEELPS